jgi:hypothetical protein
MNGHGRALAADPTATSQPAASPVLVDPLDPRAGEGASRTGAPFFALVFVIGLGAVVVVSTVMYTKLARKP